MSRLTKREGKHTVRIGNEWRRNDAVWDKLAHYEDLEEQGLLIQRPCKVGDTAWVIDKDFEKPNEMKIYEAKWTRVSLVQETENSAFELRGEVSYQVYDYFFVDGRTMLRCMYVGQRCTKVGEVVFLTKEEAQQRLEELKGGAE